MIKKSPSTPDILCTFFHNHTSLLNLHIIPDSLLWIILGFLHTHYLQIITVLFIPFQPLQCYLFLALLSWLASPV